MLICDVSYPKKKSKNSIFKIRVQCISLENNFEAPESRIPPSCAYQKRQPIFDQNTIPLHAPFTLSRRSFARFRHVGPRNWRVPQLRAATHQPTEEGDFAHSSTTRNAFAYIRCDRRMRFEERTAERKNRDRLDRALVVCHWDKEMHFGDR